MTSQHKADADRRAKAYIDKIIKINREHGMGDVVPEETYRRAIDSSVDVFKGLMAQPRRPTSS